MTILDEINKQLLTMKFKNEKRITSGYVIKQLFLHKENKFSISDFNVYDIRDQYNKEYPYLNPNITKDNYIRYKLERNFQLLLGFVNFNIFDIDYKVLIGRYEIYSGTIKSREFNYGFFNKFFLPIMTICFNEIYFLFKNREELIPNVENILYDNNLRNIRFIYCNVNNEHRKMFFGTSFIANDFFINKGIVTKSSFPDEKYLSLNFNLDNSNESK